jgi:protein AaeX
LKEDAVVGEFDIYGVYFPTFAVIAAIAFVLQLAVKRLLDAYRIYRFVWHRALFDLAVYVILLGVVTAAAAIVLPIA